jgi:hypothetical protein
MLQWLATQVASLSKAVNAITALLKTISKEVYDALPTRIRQLVDDIALFANLVYQKAYDYAKAKYDAVVSFVRGELAKAKKLIDGLSATIEKWVITQLKDAVGFINKKLAALKDIKSDVLNSLNTLKCELKEFLKSEASKLVTLLDPLNKYINELKRKITFDDIKSLLRLRDVTIPFILDFIKNPLEPVKAWLRAWFLNMLVYYLAYAIGSVEQDLPELPKELRG